MPRITDRSARLNVRLDRKTRAKIEEFACQDDRTLSQTVRTILMVGLRHYRGIYNEVREQARLRRNAAPRPDKSQ